MSEMANELYDIYRTLTLLRDKVLSILSKIDEKRKSDEKNSENKQFEYTIKIKKFGDICKVIKDGRNATFLFLQKPTTAAVDIVKKYGEHAETYSHDGVIKKVVVTNCKYIDFKQLKQELENVWR